MFAYFTPNGGAPVALTDPLNPEEDFYNEQDSSTKEIVPVQFLRSAAGKGYDRGNEITRGSFSFTKIFSTLDAARTWLTDQRIALRCATLDPPNGTFTLVMRNFDGSVKEYEVPDCAIWLRTAGSIGKSTEFIYEIVGGALGDSNRVSMPFISPDGGAVPKTVTLTCPTAGADIYYTVNGLAPTSGSTHYTVPFVLSSAALLRVIAIKSGKTDSPVAQAEFTA